jgi:hypothetical protein
VAKPSRPAGTIPAAFNPTGRDVPPSADVQEHNLAQLIGQASAFYLAQLLEPMLAAFTARQQRAACLVCAARLKAEAREYEKAVDIAVRAAEPIPEPPDTKVTESFTEGSRGPVCWGCYDPATDGPFGPRKVEYPITLNLPDGE